MRLKLIEGIKLLVFANHALTQSHGVKLKIKVILRPMVSPREPVLVSGTLLGPATCDPRVLLQQDIT
jgi:hypothetical protein